MSLPKPSHTLRLGDKAPNFTGSSTIGTINFHDYIKESWCVFFSHPDDFTPVCTTELGAFAKIEHEFVKRNTKLVGLSANTLESHLKWIDDIHSLTSYRLNFPIVADPHRDIALLYDQIDYSGATNLGSDGLELTIRSVYVIDPKQTIRLIMSYPASVGRNTAEIIRILDSLQVGDKYQVITPINWIPGDDVIIHPSVDDVTARKRFPNFKTLTSYLRLTKLPVVADQLPAAQIPYTVPPLAPPAPKNGRSSVSVSPKKIRKVMPNLAKLLNDDT